MISLPNNCYCSNLSVHPKNWQSKNAKISFVWYITYCFYDPKHEIPKQVMLKGMNQFKNLNERGKISSSLYNYLQSVQSYLAPPIAAVFLLGVFFKRLNAKGAYTAMVAGFIVGIIKLTLKLFQGDLTGILHDFATINFLYFCIYLFLFSIVVMVVVSLLSPKPSDDQIRGLTFASTVAEDRVSSRASWNKKDVILSLIVVAIIVAVFVYFSPLGVGK
jgi:SSS family solute:Na+ symporter